MRHKEYCGCLWLFKSNGLFILPQVLIKTELYSGNGKNKSQKNQYVGWQVFQDQEQQNLILRVV